jgi:hypothetical protein
VDQLAGGLGRVRAGAVADEADPRGRGDLLAFGRQERLRRAHTKMISLSPVLKSDLRLQVRVQPDLGPML